MIKLRYGNTNTFLLCGVAVNLLIDTDYAGTLPAFYKEIKKHGYQVSKMAKDAGYMPMLYTDADYAASNACYEKIGYALRGKLYTIG